MIKLSDFIVKLRAMTHDEREIEYSDEDWIRFTNDALKFVRSVILDVYPAMLADIVTDGWLVPHDDTIYLYDTPLHILSVKIDGERLRVVNPVAEEKHHYKPYGWYLLGMDKIKIVPPPRHTIHYTITGTQEFEPLKSTEEILPIPTDFESFVSEYVIMRASVTNEFSTQEEQQLAMIIRQGIEDRLKSFTPPGIVVGGYW